MFGKKQVIQRLSQKHKMYLILIENFHINNEQWYKDIKKGLLPLHASSWIQQIMPVWYYHVYYHVCFKLYITQTGYMISGKFLTQKKVSAGVALYRTLQIYTFHQQCVISIIGWSQKNQSITFVWYYHVRVIVG